MDIVISNLRNYVNQDYRNMVVTNASWIPFVGQRIGDMTWRQIRDVLQLIPGVVVQLPPAPGVGEAHTASLSAEANRRHAYEIAMANVIVNENLRDLNDVFPIAIINQAAQIAGAFNAALPAVAPQGGQNQNPVQGQIVNLAAVIDGVMQMEDNIQAGPPANN